MTSTTVNASIYCQGTFSTPNPTTADKKAMLEAAKDLGNSGFTTVILGQFHVHDDGTIYYNDAPLDQVQWALANIPAAIKQAGKVRNVLLTFGPFASDFSAIQSHLSSFKATMASVISSGHIDGLDWDLEENLNQFTSLLVDLDTWASHISSVVTAAPYYSESFWIDVLQKTVAAGGRVDWYNLQDYGGADYDSWVSQWTDTSVDAASFLQPGFAATQGATPSAIQAQLAAFKAQHPTLCGGFLWKYEAIAGSGYTTAQYAQAILDGVS